VPAFAIESKVRSVDYEYEEVKSFDDVVTWYSQPVCDARGDDVLVDYQQAKFHVDRWAQLRWIRLPSQVYKRHEIFSEKIHDAVTTLPDKYGRFILVTPWHIHPEDPLGTLISNQEGEIRLAKLFDCHSREVGTTARRHVRADSFP
jgi:hypothetical protein